MKTPQEITKNLYSKAVSFLERPCREILIGGILAGVFVSLAAITSVTVCSDMSSYFGIGFTKLVFGIVFSLGLILIVLSGSELFTGSNLYIVPVYNNKKLVKKLVIKWCLIYVANLIGAIIVIFLILNTGILNDEIISSYLVKITDSKLKLTIVQAFVRGILCNFLVCLAVRVGEASDRVSGKIIGYIYVIGAFVINSFEHSIANMFFIPIGIILGAKQGLNYSWYTFIFNNLLPVTLGNIVGGALFVGTVYYIMHCRYFTNGDNCTMLKNSRSGDSGNF
ncbi:formate/nitrite transporter family protein [Abyssisolibacter fermentans]|uniref:formate/nitrite transporter family protein n=1 Tax=Abyssisolibacter fermentans TaxID=1766203 RepID=UPI0008347607|nr:formate/nitrite transporter family protein [Abyssisolibacter fermentans]